MNNFRIILVGLISALGLYFIIYAVLFTVCILSNRNELIKKTDEDSLKSCMTESMQEEKKLSMKEEIELLKTVIAVNEDIKHQKLFQFVLSSLMSILAALAVICKFFVMLLITL